MNHQEGMLVAEDDLDDLFFLNRAISRAGLLAQTTFVRNGHEVIQYLTGAGPYENRDLHPLPKLVLLDLAMPDVSGLEVLQWVGEQLLLRQVPIVVFTGTEAPRRIERALALGARRCLFKTAEVNTWVGMIRDLAEEFDLYPTIPVTQLEPVEARRAA